MNPLARPEPISRRNFLQTVAVAAAVPLASPLSAPDREVVALQLSAVGPADEGCERVLDTLRECAGVNTILVEAFWFSPGTAEAELRQLRHRGHATQRDANSPWRGGCMGTVHPQFYRDTALDPRALMPAAPDRDLLAALLPQARRRGMKVYATFKDSLPDPSPPDSEKLSEQDFNGARGELPCKNNPYYRNLLSGVMRDLIESYQVDGIMFMAERQGALSDTLGLRFRGKERGRPGARTCFCEHCRAKAASQGIRFERAKAGFEELEKFVAAGRAHQRPVDGYYVTLWRLLLRYPELLAWEHLWHESYRELLQLLHQTVKAAQRAIQTLRARAKEWNLDKSRVGAFGGSAGAQLCMYLAFHDDLADPRSSGPVARESSRLACVATMGGQVTRDMQWWVRHVPGYDSPHLTDEEVFGVADHAEALKISAEISALSLISADDPPIYMSYAMAPGQAYPDDPQVSRAWKVHHVVHGLALKQRCDALGVDATLKYPGVETRYGSAAGFFKANLLGR